MCEWRRPALLAVVLAGLLAFLLPHPAAASNGTNMISCNFRAAGMGGAQVAVPGNDSGAACNPATLGQRAVRSVTFGTSLLVPGIGLENGLFGPNDVRSRTQAFPLVYAGYAQRLGPDSPWALGLVVFVQGGVGVEFERVRTFAGTADGFSSEIPLLRVNPSVAYRVNERLALGATVMFGRASANLSLFPNTYSPGPDGVPGTPDDFAGLDAAKLSGWEVSGRLGAHYRATETVSLGVAYTTATDFELDGGTLTLAFGPIGKATYGAQMVGLGWPQQLEFGLSAQVTPRLMLAADGRWLQWSAALDRIVLSGSQPSAPVPVANPVVQIPLEWKDQWVMAIGAEYGLTSRYLVRGGYNYGKNPVPDRLASPAFPGAVEHHVTAGLGIRIGAWTLDLAYERSFENAQRNTNPDPRENPFGPDAVVTMRPGQVAHMGLTYDF